MFGNFESRGITPRTVWGSGSEGSTNEAGVIINGDTAFTVSAFFSAVSMISDTISTLPIGAYVRNNGERLPMIDPPMWLNQPDIDLTRQAHFGQVVTSLLVYGNSFTRVFRDKNGDIVNLVVLDPNGVKVTRSAIGRKIFEVDGEKKPLTSDEVLHILDTPVPGSLVGLSRIDKLQDTLGIGSALQKFAARYFGSGLSMDVVIKAPIDMKPEQAKNLVDGFNSRHSGWRKSNRAGIITGGADIQKLNDDPEKAQVLESRRFVVEEIARAFAIPLHQMGVPGTNTFASVEQGNLQWLSHGLRPILEKIEWAYSTLLPVPRAFIKFNFNALLRGDLQSRATAYSILTQAGIMSVNDARKLEDLSAVDGGDMNRVPLANIDLKSAALTGDEMKVKMAQIFIQVGFEPADVLAKLGLPSLAHTGVPSASLQQVSTIDPNAPATVYGVN